MRLRAKLTIAFFGVSSVLAVLLALFYFRFVERQLSEEYRERLRDVSQVGTRAIDLAAYQRLLAKLGTIGDIDWDKAEKDLDKDEIAQRVRLAEIEHSADYKIVYDQLRMIRATEPRLIHFSYLLAPTDDPDKPRFVVDADVLELRAKLQRDKKLDEHEEISHFDQEYALDDPPIPLLRQALLECTPQLEPDFVYDEEFDLTSISAYIPLQDVAGNPLRDAKGRCLGVLGVDLSDSKMQAILSDARWLAIKLSLAVVAIALIISIAMGTVLTRSIMSLTSSVRRFAEKDFTARTSVNARDEIGQLAKDFNAMAESIQHYSENLEELVKVRTSELSEEKATSERLLLNVLPAPIAERLKTGESLIVDRFDAVTVMFADIAGFTAMSARTSPEELVTMLNELFSLFDKLAEQHGLEKIKTIGDAYMVVAGIPQPIADHATAIAHMALDMQAGIDEYSRRTNSNLSIRIGIHTGSCVAGVIGTKKFIYDLWGDTVNTASRMESSGVAGRIQVSEATYELLKEQFDFEPRGPIEVKGKGQMSTYLLIGQKTDPDRISIGKIARRMSGPI